jgi:hypothetical protein
MAQPEFIIQREFVKYMKLQHPKVLYCASAGGLHTSPNQAQKMKAAGYVKGFPDMTIFEPSGPYKGLFIEIKAAGGKVSPEQKEWVEKLNQRGYCAKVCKGLGECMDTLNNYLAGKI